MADTNGTTETKMDQTESEKETVKETTKNIPENEPKDITTQDESDKTPVKTESDKTPVKTESDKTPVKTESDKTPVKTELDKSPAKTESDKPPIKTESDKEGERTVPAPSLDISVSEALCKRLVKQLEYYFGDMNLPRDRFLQDQIKGDDGWVKIETLLTFNRLKKISDDINTIAYAVKKSASQILEVSECLLKLRRSQKKPIPENTKERRTDINARSVYVKGFPVDCGMDEVEEFFKAHGTVDSIFMKRTPKEKSFKGSVFATFSSKEESEKFLKTDGLKYRDTDAEELMKMLKDEYFTMKQKQKAALKPEEEVKRKEEEKIQEDDKQKLQKKITTGAILDLQGIADNTQREDIRNYFSDYAEVAWVDFDRGDKQARIRFEGENGAKLGLEKAKEANEDKIVINTAEVVTRVLEGEEELDHWRSIFNRKQEGRSKKRQQPFNKGKRKFRQGGFGKQFHRGDGEPQEKHAKVE